MLLYRCLFTLALPLLALALLIKVLRRRETMGDFFERLGFWQGFAQKPVVWCHAASNGELAAARVIIKELALDGPILITCNSLSGKALAKSWNMKDAQIRLAPIDLRWVYHLLIRRMDLQKFVLFEADFWPNRIAALSSAGIPIALIGGRISSKSAKGWQRFSALAARTFGNFDLISAQDNGSASRLQDLGANADAFQATLSLKSLYHAATNTAASKRDMTWLAASTHAGEDGILLQAHKIILQSQPEMKMILAPRHPKRGADIAQIAQRLGLSAARRSQSAQIAQASEVYIADTLGEMAQWYHSAQVCFVAGSLVPKGGHTPYEPRAHDCALLHGPNVENFADAYAALGLQNGALMCATAEEIAAAVLALQDPKTAKVQRENARKALSHSDTMEQILTALQTLAKN